MSFMEVLYRLPFSDWLRSAPLAYPVLEVVHLVGLAAVFGSLLVVDLRLLGLLRTLPLGELGRQVLPWTLSAFVLTAASGLLMFMANALELIGNPMFLSKLVLLALAGINAALLHRRGSLDTGHPAARTQAALSLSLWVGIIFCGRWIAYV